MEQYRPSENHLLTARRHPKSDPWGNDIPISSIFAAHVVTYIKSNICGIRLRSVSISFGHAHK